MRRGLAVLVLVLAVWSPAAALGATPRTSFTDVERSVMCVSCNVALTIAESPQADRERAEIRALVAQGLTKQEVLDRLVDDYGPNVLAEPEARGFNTVAYLVPVAAVLALGLLGLVLLPRWRRSRAEQAAADEQRDDGPDLSRADTERLDAELARHGA